MIPRKLLINSQPRNDIESGLKSMYLKRVQEMFKRTIDVASIFNIFDEVFHGLSQSSLISDELHSFYESFLIISSYYQHSQAGRGNLATKLIKGLGETEKIEFELNLKKLPKFLGLTHDFNMADIENLKFDVVNKVDKNIIFCELKMKVYSGCTAGRIELMEKFNKFVNYIIESHTLRSIIKEGQSENVILIGGVLFDIKGDPATLQKDKEWGLCYGGLLRGKDSILNTIIKKGIKHDFEEFDTPEKAFKIHFNIDEINVYIIAVYGNEVIKSLFSGRNTENLEYFRTQIEGIFYDDVWLGQLIAISERVIINNNFKRFKKLNNYVTSILSNEKILLEISELNKTIEAEKIVKLSNDVLNYIEDFDSNLLTIRPAFAETILTSIGEEYSINDYIADIIQFLSCKKVLKFLQS